MSPAEAAAAAFGDAGVTVGESAVYAAQCKYIEPVLGAEMCAALAEGRHAEMLGEYVKPALAMFVKYAMLPSAAWRVPRTNIPNTTRAGT